MTDKPKRPATSGTRRGNGAGWGGPAKGIPASADTASKFEPGNKAALPAGERASVMQRTRATRDAMIAVYERIAADETAPPMAQITAADKWLDRHEGKPIARMVNMTPDDVSVLDDGTLASIALGRGAETTH